MAKAKDKTTKRKRTPTAKAAAAAPTVAPARAGKKPKKQSAKPTGAAQLPVETQETATLDHIVWDPPETTDTGSQDVDTWDMSDLARAALALPEEFKAEVDAAWNAADTAKALRDISFRKGGLSALAPFVQPHELAQHADHASVETTRKYYLSQTIENRAANTALMTRTMFPGESWAAGVQTESVWSADIVDGEANAGPVWQRFRAP